MCRELSERHSIKSRKQVNLAEQTRITEMIGRHTREGNITRAVPGSPF